MRPAVISSALQNIHLVIRLRTLLGRVQRAIRTKVQALWIAVWWAWKEHERYLEVEGPVAIVSGAGVLETMPVHPLFGPSHPMRGPGPLLTARGVRFR